MQVIVDESASRGKIVIATKKYLPGELILEEKPIMVVPKQYSMLCKMPEDEDQPFTLSQSFGCFCWFQKQMSVGEQSRVLGLFGRSDGCEDDRLRGMVEAIIRRDDGRPVSVDEIETFVKLNNIVRSNRFHVDGDQILYHEMSNFAHSCDANCQFMIEPRRKIVRCRVTKPIQAGEEMTVSYTAELDQQPTHIRRQRYLEERWITCHCPRCDAPGDDTRQFDCSEPTCNGCMVMRERINKVKHFLPDLYYDKVEHVEPHLLPCTVCHGRPHARYEDSVSYNEAKLPVMAQNITAEAEKKFASVSALKKNSTTPQVDVHPTHRDRTQEVDVPRSHALSIPIFAAQMKLAVCEYLQFQLRCSIDHHPRLARLRSDVHVSVSKYITAQEAVTKGAHISTLQVLLNVCRVCIFAVQQLDVSVPVYPPSDAKELLQKTLRLVLVLYGRDVGHKLPDCAELGKCLRQALDEAPVSSEGSGELCAFCEESPVHASMKRSRCGACKKVMYCSAGCQKAHWKLHKKICKT